MKQFYITTAIDYANGSPHIGHAYEKVLTDVIARHRRLSGDSTYFLTGLDEHGQKVQQTARKEGVEPIDYCDQIAEKFQRLCSTLLISNDDFIRTTQSRHKDVVRKILQDLFDKGEIYKADYQGFYSKRQEQFLQEKDKVNGEWPEIFGEVEEVSEPAYFFKLNQYQDWLIKHLKESDDFIFPRFRQKQVLEFLKEPLNDLCISRPKERLEWGIPLPFDEDFVCYVWFDALTNYISAVGYGTEGFADKWPADFHVIGKDILVPPHAVYWPIMLHAAGIPLPKSLLVHGWWNISGEKMSKTLGNVVDPFVLAEQVGPDALRYFFIREMNVGQDSDFSADLLLSRYKDDLGNDFGNQLNRLLSLGGKLPNKQIPQATIEEQPEKDVRELWEKTYPQVIEYYNGFLFHRGLETLWAFIRKGNAYLEIRQPWKLAKSEDPADQERARTALAYTAEILRLASVLLTPVMPEISKRVFAAMGADSITNYEGNLEWDINRFAGNVLGERTILFPRIEN
ncbi:methionine--tRNA ligase [Cerasicoccus arenae]|uniref:methionine--tRNA ligase n=1 Tax=Cerasicoccus arenae TaxID=424488 RepID=A0A8J3DDM6_9BACT|nr:methionine--tRNA ligase [Cerasicoccus arenae]MBK1859333.1 methionine--tRNA ligase [Cerasicoccus arenae]GHB93886.1 methionine--tRNA ligase [Cerasicoccus arenae]